MADQQSGPSRAQAFLTELASLLSSTGWIMLTILRVGDHPIAWNYGFQFSRSWFCYMPTFDADCGEFSPGLAFSENCGSSLRTLESSGLTWAWLGRLQTAIRQWRPANPGLYRYCLDYASYLREAARYHIAAAIKSSPRLEHGVRRMMGTVFGGRRVS